MLLNAKGYQNELQDLLYEVWYDPKYQYYFTSPYRYSVNLDETAYLPEITRDFISVNSEGKIVGYICYIVDSATKLAYNFGAINFTDDGFTFGRDLYQAIDDIFVKFGMETFEFSVVRGNPVEKRYDHLVDKLGGRILCTRHARARNMAGEICDDKLYEITREEYLNYKNGKKIHSCANPIDKLWGLVGFDRITAMDIMSDIEIKSGKDVLERRYTKNELATTFLDGTILRWIPQKLISRQYRIGRMWCDKSIDKDFFNMVVLSCYRGKTEDIIWI